MKARPVQFRATRVTLTAASSPGGPPRFAMVANTGEPMRIYAWSDPVVIDLETADLGDQRIPALYDHCADADHVVGQVETLAIQSRMLTAAGVLIVDPATPADRNFAQQILTKARAGYQWQASVGADPATVEEVAAGAVGVANWGRQYPGPCVIGRGCRFREISFVVLGGDRKTSVVVSRNSAGATMTFEEWVASLGLDPANLSDEQKASLMEAFQKLYPTGPDSADPPGTDDAPAPNAAAVVEILTRHAPDLAARSVRERWDVNRANAESLARIRAGRPAAPPTVIRGTGAGTITARHVECALLIKAGHTKAAMTYGEEIVNQSDRLGRASMVDIAAAFMRATGKQVPRDTHELIRAGFSSGDLAVTLGNTANKIVEMVWRESEPTWQSFCAKKSAKDLKTHTSLRPTFGGDLAPMPSGAAFDSGKLGEETIEWSVARFGKQYKIDEITFINDDADVLSELVPGLARAAARTLANLIYAVLLRDLATHFTTGRGNVQTGGGSVLQSSSLATAVKQMRLMTDPDDSPINLTPAVLLVGPSLEQTARGLLNSTDVLRDQSDDFQPTGNTLQGVARLEVEPRIEAGVTHPTSGVAYSGSATKWFLFASPADLPVLVAGLNGQLTPRITTVPQSSDPDHLATTFQCSMYVGAAMGDYRAAQYSPGA